MYKRQEITPDVYEPVKENLFTEPEDVLSFVVEHSRPVRKQDSLNRYRTYLSRAYEKHCKKKTFLYEMQRDFYGFFVCNDKMCIRDRTMRLDAILLLAEIHWDVV